MTADSGSAVIDGQGQYNTALKVFTTNNGYNEKCCKKTRLKRDNVSFVKSQTKTKPSVEMVAFRVAPCKKSKGLHVTKIKQ